MLYGNESISQYSRSNFFVWMVMAFQAGLLNIGGFMACHRFVSHVTGFATFFGLELAQSGGWSSLGMLTVPFFFLLGSMLSGVLIDLRLTQHKKPRYYISYGIIFVLILSVFIFGCLGLLGNFGESQSPFQSYSLLILLCLVCGIQNGTISTVSKSVVRTTHLTGITTDLGLGLVRVFNGDRVSLDYQNEFQANKMRIGVIFFYGLGSVAGGFSFKDFGYLGFILPTLTSGVLFCTMLYFQVYRATFFIRKKATVTKSQPIN